MSQARRNWILPGVPLAAGFGICVAIFVHDPLRYQLRIGLAAVATPLLFLGALVSLLVIRRAKLPSRWRLIPFVAILFGCFTALELGATLQDRSHSSGHTLAAHRWVARHWKPINSLGYRDPEPNEVKGAGPQLVFLGDSFTAGHGIKDPADRFTDQLALGLGDEARVYNVGMCGADAKRLLENLRGYPIQGDVVVYTYFGNDILDSAAVFGHRPPAGDPLEERLDPLSAFVIGQSHFANHVYWAFPQDDLSSYWTFFEGIWRDEKVLERHRADLQAIVDEVKARKAKLAVVLFPLLHDLEGSAHYCQWVKSFFESQGVPVLEVEGFVKDLTVRERIVNNNDVHPSVRVHHRVAKELSRYLREQGLLGPPER